MRLDLFNPFSNQYHACQDFKKLTGCQKFGIIVATFFTSIFGLGFGGVATFRKLVGRCKKIEAQHDSTTKKINNIQKQIIPTAIEYRALANRLFAPDDRVFEADKIQLQDELLKIQPLMEIIKAIKSSDDNKNIVLVNSLYVFFGLKPAFIEEDFQSLSKNERAAFQKLTNLNPHFNIDYSKSIVVNEQPEKRFDPRDYLPVMLKKSIKDSTLEAFPKMDKGDYNFHLSYLLGFGPTIHVYERRGRRIVSDFQFKDEHYLQLGKALNFGDDITKNNDASSYIESGKQICADAPHSKKRVELSPILVEDDLHRETNKLLEKYYIFQVADEHTMHTDYWIDGMRFRERIFQIFDLPFRKSDGTSPLTKISQYKEFQKICSQLFITDEAVYKSEKAALKTSLLKFPQFKLFIEMIDKEKDYVKLNSLIGTLYVFIGIKPVLYAEYFEKFSDSEKAIIQSLSAINPHFKVDYDKQIIINNMPHKSFDPKRFLKNLPEKDIEDFIINCFKNQHVDCHADQYLSYLLGYGPTYHAFIAGADSDKIKNINSKASFEDKYVFSDEHYRQMGKALCAPKKDEEDFYEQAFIYYGKEFYQDLNIFPPMDINQKKKIHGSFVNESLETLRKYGACQFCDELSLKTDYWIEGIKLRKRLMNLFL